MMRSPSQIRKVKGVCPEVSLLLIEGYPFEAGVEVDGFGTFDAPTRGWRTRTRTTRGVRVEGRGDVRSLSVDQWELDL